MEQTIKLKPFDLQECMTKHGGRCVTRDGRSARIVCTDYRPPWPFPDETLLVLVSAGPDDGEEPESYKENGSYIGPPDESPKDLFLPVQIQMVYIVGSTNITRFLQRSDAERVAGRSVGLKVFEAVEETSFLPNETIKKEG